MENLLQKKIFEITREYKNIIWDWNGTLIDDAGVAAQANSVLLSEHGLPEISRDDYRRLFRHPVTSYYETLGFDLQATDFRFIGDRFIALYEQLSREALLFRGTEQLLEVHRSAGQNQAILSAATEKSILLFLERFNIRDYFAHVFGLDNHYHINKLERGRQLMEFTGWRPKETILVGDTDHDHETAELLGVDLLLVADGHQDFARLAETHANGLAEIQANVIESRY